MKIICAPDSYKESMSATQAARAMMRGIFKIDPNANVDVCPIADGGEGTVQAVLDATQGQRKISQVVGPLGELIDATWGLVNADVESDFQKQNQLYADLKNSQQNHNASSPTAIIEMASAAGLMLVDQQSRDPTKTTTFGVGQLINAALTHHVGKIWLGIGGSATHDGGCGMAQAIGVQFFDQQNQLMIKPLTGGDLQKIKRIDLMKLDPRIKNITLSVACDVTNPMTGPMGAAAVYSPQKGATSLQVKLLEDGLGHLADLFETQLGKKIVTQPGTGAAGGLGGGLIAFLNAKLTQGIEMVLDAVDFDRRVRGCDLCLTGEGKLDGQSIAGKACLGVAKRARQYGVPTIALVGSASDDAKKTLQAGLQSYHVIGPHLPITQSIAQGPLLLEHATIRLLENKHLPNGD